MIELRPALVSIVYICDGVIDCENLIHGYFEIIYLCLTLVFMVYTIVALGSFGHIMVLFTH